MSDGIQELLDEALDCRSIDRSQVERHATISPHYVAFSFDGVPRQLRLTKGHLRSLIKSGKVGSISRFKYLSDCGFCFAGYGEAFIQIENPSVSHGAFVDSWPADSPLRFRIGDVNVDVGPASTAAVLLLESSCLGQYFCGTGFSGFPTIKVCVQDLACHQEAIEKALYYLNSCYLPKRGFRATVRHLSIEEDNTGLWEEIEGDPVGFFAGGLARKRRRTRKDFRTILPIRLYNLACSLSGELRFLTFYRVLEFFFDEASDRRLSAARHDASVPDGELAKIAADRNREESCLASVLDLSAPAGSSARKRLLDYTTGHRLVGKHTAAEVAEQLYSFRNSLVHAKESETSRTRLPDPFSAENDMLRQWCYVAQTYARLAIAAFAAK